MNLAPVRAKTNAHYTCQECGSTELIQAHHEIPGDDNSLIVLCAECHSRRHPDLPKSLFFNKRNQPYWNNKSASSLAKELGICSRTIIRTAKRLDILPGELSQFDDWLLRVQAIKNKIYRNLKNEQINPLRTCPRCGYTWRGIKPTAGETTCPRCGNWIALNKPEASMIRHPRKVPLIPKTKLEQLKKNQATGSEPIA